MKSRAVLCTLLVFAAGCERMQPMLSHAGFIHDLGDFDVERIGFVPSTPLGGDGYDGGGFLKVELASSRQLTHDYPTYWLGVASDFCPLIHDHHLISFGALDQGGNFWGRNPPIKRSSDGKYRYQVYVVREYPPPGKTHDDYGYPRKGPNAQKEYDILANQGDLCLQIVGGDHYNVFARSSVIRLDRAAIMKAAVEAEANIII